MHFHLQMLEQCCLSAYAEFLKGKFVVNKVRACIVCYCHCIDKVMSNIHALMKGDDGEQFWSDGDYGDSAPEMTDSR